MALILDAGALIAIERSDREVIARLLEARFDRIPVRTTSPVVAQVWRSGARQARVARLLQSTEEHPLDEAAARRVGALLGASGTSDVVDASIVDLADSGDEILTTDPDDLRRLANAAGKDLDITRVG